MERWRVIGATILGLACASTSGGADQRELVARQLERSRAESKDEQSWSARREQLRHEFRKAAGLDGLPNTGPPVAIIHSRREHEGYSVENIAIESFPGFYATGNLYRPLGKSGPFAAVLCPHGHFQPLGRMREEQQIRCAHLARMGAIVLSYSMVGWQDSMQTSHADPLVLTLQTINSLRCVDYLCRLPDVDSSRLAVTGASGGGTQSVYLALLDDRIRVCAPAVIIYPWTCPAGCACEGGLPIMQAADTNIIEITAAIAPRPLLVLSVGKDDTRDFPQVGAPFIEGVYRLHGKANLFRNLHLPEEEHDYGPSKRQAMYAFFSEHLGLPTVDEDLAKITIETPERMAAFDSAHPWPKTAAMGRAAVSMALAKWLGGEGPRTADPIAGIKTVAPEGESFFFRAPGFGNEGSPKTRTDADAARLRIVVTDSQTHRPTPCRINVVGPDGNFYQPATNRLSEFSLVHQWPEKGKGNRKDKAPYRYLGRFFYSTGEVEVAVPPGEVRIEVCKGFEYRPVTITLTTTRGQTHDVGLTLENTLHPAKRGYFGGDPHLHFRRASEQDERLIFDMMEAEDIRYASLLAYNDPAGPYVGFLEKMDSPQLRGLGDRSVLERRGYWLMSGQEYRTSVFGHLNLHQREDLLFAGESFNADEGPVYGEIAATTKRLGGYAVYAHGGYAQEIYADVAQGAISAVELLQFDLYRGIGRDDWYHILNSGYRLPATGASDYPACRFLGDCRTYVESKSANPTFQEWLEGMAEGRSFVTTGPMLYLDVDGRRPGDVIDAPEGGSRKLNVNVVVQSEVAPVTDMELVINGRVVARMAIANPKLGEPIEWTPSAEISQSSWIAARAYSTTLGGQPDAESHTNPVYVLFDKRMPCSKESLDAWVAKLDGQIAIHAKRDIPEKARILAYFQTSRDILLRIREMGGLRSDTRLDELVKSGPSNGDRDLSADGSIADATEEELKAFLKPVPATTPEEQLGTFDTASGFEMQLVAAEPMVFDPIAGTFDENGNLYICEMRDYPYKPTGDNLPIGSVRLLKDTDGDGRMDESHLFAKHLLWAGGVACWRGGVFVAAPPDIWYMKDADGDGTAELRLQVFTGFGDGNQQAMLNNLVWWLDHKIHGSTAGNGGTITPGADWREYLRTVEGIANPPAPFSSIVVTGHDFCFDPRTGGFETITGTQQFGTTFDDWGNRFLCNESNPLHHVVLPEHYQRRNPFLVVPSAIQNAAPSPVPIHRISPVERWRHIRSSRRIAKKERSSLSAGASHHVIDAAAGVTVYRGDAYGPDYVGDIFVADGQNNLIHRRKLIADGVTFTSKRADETGEFVRSSDLWFRPVNFVPAPDGTLYCLDMSREVLETIHIPLDVVKHLDLTSGRDHGRIYRMAPRGFRSPASPKLGGASTDALVAALKSPDGWLRDTAVRLLHERQDSAAIATLEMLAIEGDPPTSRLCALWTLDGMGVLSDAVVKAALADPVAPVRENAVRLAERRLNGNPEILGRVIELARDKDARVRFQVALSLGESESNEAAASLTALAKSTSDDPWMRAALASSLTRRADRVLVELLADRDFLASSDGFATLDSLARMIGSQTDADPRNRILVQLATRREELSDANCARILAGLGAGLKRSGARFGVPEAESDVVASMLQEFLSKHQAVAIDSKVEESVRVAAIEFVSCWPFARTRELLEQCLDPRQPPGVQVAAVKALGDYSDPESTAVLLAAWNGYAPTVRTAAIDAMFSREQRMFALLESAASGRARLADLDLARREFLRQHKKSAIAELARKVFGDSADPDRAQVIANYRAALDLPAALANGAKVFDRHCAGCHEAKGKGDAVGPSLASSAHRDRQSLIENILDPNRTVLPAYMQYIVIDAIGKSYSGVIAAQTATSLTLQREKGASDTILLADVEEIRSTGRSLMPEGFEKTISVQEMADLVAYLQSIAPTGQGDVRTRDFGTLPGLAEP